jgi:hypothetical protein
MVQRLANKVGGRLQNLMRHSKSNGLITSFSGDSATEKLSENAILSHQIKP